MKNTLKIMMVLAFTGIILSGCSTADNAENVSISEIAEETKVSDEVTSEEVSTDISESAADAEEGSESHEELMKEMRVGSTGFTIMIPEDYYGAEVTETDRRDDMIAYYKSDKHLMDFDVYQFAKEGRSLSDYTDKESKEYGADLYETTEINGIDVTLYFSEEKYDGNDYKVANYIFEGESDFGEISFWLDGDDAEELAEKIIRTLSREQSDVSDMDMEALGEYLNSEEYKKKVQEAVDEAIKNSNLTLEKRDSSEDVSEVDGGLFITKNGVECREVQVDCINDLYHFNVELYNETGTDQTFDMTKFVLETSDGELIDPFLLTEDEEPEIKADLVRLWMSYTLFDPKNLKVGDEVSVYYDGVLINKVSVEAK